jgi:hypothetical protein
MKKFLIIVVVILVGLGAWWFFGLERSYTFSGASSPSARGVSAHPGIVAGAFIASSTAAVSGATNGVVAQAEQAFENAVSSAGATLMNARTDTVNAAKDAIDNAFEGAVGAGGNFLGIATSVPSNGTISGSATGTAIGSCQNNDGIICIFVDPVANIGQPISFTIDGSFFSEHNVQEIDAHVNWGDGVDEYQKLYATNGNYALTHAFTAAGTYQSLFTFDIGTSTIQYEMKIVVRS